MRWVYDWGFFVVWGCFLVYWRLMAPGTKPAQRIEGTASQAIRVLLFLGAIAVLSVPIPLPFLYRQFMPQSAGAFFVGLGITVAGLLFAVWARVHLGRNWSQTVMIKQEHELITSGPYAWVRHPIYTGILAGFLGSAVATAQVRGVLALLLVLGALWGKLRLEERWMGGHFGATYAEYARRVPALVPRPW